MKPLLLIAALVLLFTACDSSTPPDLVPPGDEPVALTPQPAVTLSNGRVSVQLNRHRIGGLSRSTWIPDPLRPEVREDRVYDSGLWITADADRANATTEIPSTVSGFGFEFAGDAPAGIFTLTQDSLEAEILNWPVAQGAPVGSDGAPKLYGDRMAWAAYRSPASPDVEETSIPGLRVGVTVFLFDEEPLSNVLFVRYDLHNTSSTSLSNVHAGYFVDTDLRRTGDCAGIQSGYNRTGYDLGRHLSYTYVSPRPEDGAIPAACYGTISGMTILDMTSASGLGHTKLAHRVVRKVKSGPFAAFAEEDIRDPNHVRLALEGLSPTGAAMIDPSTLLETRFAYTGDPIGGTGWVDDPYDVRSLQSIAPFDLAPGETKSVTVAWLNVVGSDLADGLNRIRAQFDVVMGRRESWDR